MAFRFRHALGVSNRRRAAVAVVATSVAAGALVASTAVGSPTPTPFAGWSHQSFQDVFDAHAGNAVAAGHTYSTPDSGSLAVDANHGVLTSDRGGPLQLTANTQPKHGTLALNPDGSFQYIPDANFTGTDTFTYTVSNAVHLYTDHLPSLGTVNGVDLNAGGYGSSMYPDPGHPGYFYGLEDRGPNVTAPDGNLVVPVPTYDPSIGLFQMVGNDAVLIRKIPLTGPQGQPYSGLIPANRATPDEGKVADVNGNLLANDPNGYDSEGLVAMSDGSFWVSDEYGPYITHFDQWGHQLQRLSPLNGTLPPELQLRVANRGMEGLTVTPDGKELVGMMQSSLQQPDLNGGNAKKLTPLRIVTYNLKTHAEHEYLYLLHDPATNGGAVSELTALSDTTFLVDERDGCFPGDPGLNPPLSGAAPTVCATTATGASFKQLFKIDISGATDISSSEHVVDPGHTVTYDAGTKDVYGPTENGGLLIDGHSLEFLLKGQNTAQSQATLAANHITPVTESLYVDLNAVLGSVNPTYGFYSHDKIEGVAALDGGKELVISNDSDFGLAGAVFANGTSAPYALQEKFSPVTGQEDNGEYLAIDMNRVNPTTGVVSSSVSTGTVTIHVTAAPSS
jgi:hypothetical protein